MIRSARAFLFRNILFLFMSPFMSFNKVLSVSIFSYIFYTFLHRQANKTQKIFFMPSFLSFFFCSYYISNCRYIGKRWFVINHFTELFFLISFFYHFILWSLSSKDFYDSHITKNLPPILQYLLLPF